MRKRFTKVMLFVLLMIIPANLPSFDFKASVFDIHVEQLILIDITVVIASDPLDKKE